MSKYLFIIPNSESSHPKTSIRAIPTLTGFYLSLATCVFFQKICFWDFFKEFS